MQSFLNSPPGPLGAAGQSSNTTMPANIFNNAQGPLTGNLNQISKPFAETNQPGEVGKRPGEEGKFSDTLKSLFSGLFGGEGQMSDVDRQALEEAFGSPEGLQALFASNQPGAVPPSGAVPGALPGAVPSGPPGAAAPTMGQVSPAPSQGGVLNQFMPQG